MKYPASYLSLLTDKWLGYSATTFWVGDPDDEIFVVLDSNLACLRSKVVIPDATEDKPTTIELTTAFVPIPDGMKSTLTFDPDRYASYEPNPVALNPPGEVDNLPYSRIETLVPSWTIFSSCASNSFPLNVAVDPKEGLVTSGAISTRTFREWYVLAILTIFAEVPDPTIVLSESINTPPTEVDPVLRKLSFKL